MMAILLQRSITAAVIFLQLCFQGPGTTAENVANDKLSCGVIALQPRITGGTAASKNEFKWMVNLKVTDPSPKSRREYQCAAAVIDKQWLLTAAHCAITGNSTNVIYAEIGKYQLSESGPPVLAQEVKVHPNYTTNPDTKLPTDYDIALLKLLTPIPNFNDTIIPICLPDDQLCRLSAPRSSPTVDSCGNVIGAGWGVTDKDPNSDVLKKVVIFT